MSLKIIKGGRDSESFITVAEADALLADLPDDPAEWEALSEADKEYRLILSAQVLGLLPWRGRQTYCGQALCWPRSVYQHGIPAEVKEAQAQVAYTVIHRGLAQLPDSASEDPSMSDLKSVSLGGILSVTFATDGGLSGGTMLDRLVGSIQFPVYMRLKRWLSQMRWGTILETTDDEYPTCSTTTTTSSTAAPTTTSTT